MPAVTADTLTLPRLEEPAPDARPRPVVGVTTAPRGFEGEGFPVHRAFAGVPQEAVDPFVHVEEEGEGDQRRGVQLWVSLPAKDKMTPPRYQSLGGDQVKLVSSPAGGALVRIVAGDVAAHHGPGATHTPISYVHATVAVGARLSLPWSPDFNA